MPRFKSSKDTLTLLLGINATDDFRLKPIIDDFENLMVLKNYAPYVNHELPDVQNGFTKGRGTRDQIANISWIIQKAREFQKNIYISFIDYAKAFDCVDHNKLWKILKEMGPPDHLNCLLRNLKNKEKNTGEWQCG